MFKVLKENPLLFEILYPAKLLLGHGNVMKMFSGPRVQIVFFHIIIRKVFEISQEDKSRR